MQLSHAAFRTYLRIGLLCGESTGGTETGESGAVIETLWAWRRVACQKEEVFGVNTYVFTRSFITVLYHSFSISQK